MQFDLETAVKHPHRIRHRHSDKVRFKKVVFLPDLDALLLQDESDDRLLLYRNGEWGSYLVLESEPELVPWASSEDVPDGVWFKYKDGPGVFRMVGADGNQVLVGVQWYYLNELFDRFEFSTTRSGPWLPCGKEAKREAV